MDGQATFSRKENGLYIRAEHYTLKVAGLPRLVVCLHPLLHLLLSLRPVVYPNKIGAREDYGNRVTATRASVKSSGTSRGATYGFECALESNPLFAMCSVLGELLISDGQKCVSRVDCNLAAALLSTSKWRVCLWKQA